MSPDKLKYELGASFEIVKDRCSDDEICIICPLPGCGDKSGNRYVNVRTLRTHCWRCPSDQPGHVRSLYHAMGLEFEDDHILEPDELAALMRGTPKKPTTPLQEVRLPKGFAPLSENRDSCYWKFCRRMAERKNLSIEDFEAVGAGFVREGDWEPFCIFPVVEKPRIVYYQGRTYDDAGRDRTKKFPSKKEVPYGMSYWVYGLDDLSDPGVQMLVVVESILNYLSLKRRLDELNLKHIAPVCTFTHYLSRAQIAKLRRYKHIQEWCLLYDSDSTELAQKTAVSLNVLLPTTIATMPKGVNADGSVRATNDANDDVDTALIAVADRTRPEKFNLMAKEIYPYSSATWGQTVGEPLKSKHFSFRSKRI